MKRRSLASRTRGVARHELLHRSALFSVSVGLSTAVGLISIPMLNAQVGKEGFAVLALTQAIMQFLAVLMAFGWGATGPSTVSAMPKACRKAFFAASVRARLLLTAAGIPISCLILLILTPLEPVQVGLAAVAYSMPAIGAAWYFVGTNRPVALFLFDGLPPLLGQVAGLAALLLFPNLTSYLVCIIIANITGVIFSWWYVGTRDEDGPWRGAVKTPIAAMLRDQVPGVLTVATASLSAALPMILINQFAPRSLPEFAIIDRLYRYAIIVLGPVLQAIQSWVPEAGATQTPHRARVAVWISGAVGVAGGLCLALLSPWVAPLMSLGNISVSLTVSTVIGIAFLGEAVSQVSGLSSMVALGGSRELAHSSTVATVVGMALVTIFVSLWGVLGAVLAICISAVGLAAYRVASVSRLATRFAKRTNQA